jgi:hypothetical protein
MDMGIETGVDSVEGLMDIGEWLGEVLGHPLPGRVLGAGPRWSVISPMEWRE